MILTTTPYYYALFEFIQPTCETNPTDWYTTVPVATTYLALLAGEEIPDESYRLGLLRVDEHEEATLNTVGVTLS